MAVRFFGQYLLEAGVITAQQLLEALAVQRRMNVRFGQVAVAAGLLKEDQIMTILRLQRSKGLRVGEAAVALGFMTEVQVERVLRAQRNHHLMLGEALLESGALTREELDRHVLAFRAEQAQFKPDVHFPDELDPTGLAAVAIDLTIKFLLRVGGIEAKIEDSGKGIPSAGPARVLWVSLRFLGDSRGEVFLMAERTLAAALATAMLGRPVDDEASMVDSLKEFLNVVGGNLASMAARKGGRNLELTTPEAKPPVLAPGAHSMTARLISTEGAMSVSLVLE